MFCSTCSQAINSNNKSAFNAELCGLCEEEKTYNQQVSDFKSFITINPHSEITLKQFRLTWIANDFVRKTGMPCIMGFPENGQSRFQNMMVRMILADVDVANTENPATKEGEVDEFIEFAKQDPRSTVSFKEFKIMKSKATSSIFVDSNT
jgi:hypothetical protein